MRVIALAFGLACFAMSAAQADEMRLSGLADIYAGSMRMAGDAGHDAGMGDSGMSTSWFGIAGSENVGNGVSVGFALSSFLRLSTGATGRFDGDSFWARDAHVDVIAPWGALSLGRDVSPDFLPTILFNPFGDSFAFSPLVVHYNTPGFNAAAWPIVNSGDTGWNNQIRYTTPDWGGLKTSLHYQVAPDGQTRGRRNIGASALYFRGPVGLTAFYEDLKAASVLLDGLPGDAAPLPAGARQRFWMIGGSYDWRVVKVFATWGQQCTGVIERRMKTASVGASVPIGSGRLLAAWARTSHQDDGSTGSAQGRRQTASFGYDYDLSRRTDLYANVMLDRITGFPTANGFGIGIRHRF